MRRRLLLAITLAGDPELLISDRPSLGLDLGGVREVRALLTERAGDGTAMFLSSHRPGEVEAVCDRVGILADGRLRAVASVDELRERLRAGERLRVTTDEQPSAARTDDAVDREHPARFLEAVGEVLSFVDDRVGTVWERADSSG